jgi:hypothetical protein
VTTQQIRAQILLSEWHRLRDSGACAYIFDIQERKDRLENLAGLLSAELYCSPAENLDDVCGRFEHELEKFRQNVHVDLIAGLKTSSTK